MEIITEKNLTEALPKQKLNWDYITPFLMRALKIQELNNLYQKTYRLEGTALIDSVLKKLGITFEIDPEDLKHIPLKGGFVVVSNHPYGGLDGLLMLKLFLQVRPDFKVLANRLLLNLTGLQSAFVPVDPFKPDNRKNIPSLRQVLEHLHNDMPVGIFPAGEVSSFSFLDKRITDPKWKEATRRLIDLAKVPVIPMHFEGTNSLSFQMAGLLHPSFRTALLPSELFNKKGQAIQVRLGQPISYAALQQIKDKDKLPYLRARTYAMGTNESGLQKLEKFLKPAPQPVPLIPEVHASEIEKELKDLRGAARLFTHDQYVVYLANHADIPKTIREIGRLRELTFRQVGEGTNQEKDLDWYDQHYKHLILYDREAKLLVGAYRLGEGQKLYGYFGKKGFYLNSLFKIKKPFADILKQSVELGRSFVRPEYQKKPLPLLLLWKGISVFLEGKPQYEFLIGPVSISNYFSSVSKALIVDFILEHYYDVALAKHIRPRKKFRYRLSENTAHQILLQSLTTISSLNDLVNKIETRQAGLPVLLKKYLKQNARIIGFNLDPKFSNALDGFMIMEVKDLPSSSKKMLKRYNQAEVFSG